MMGLRSMMGVEGTGGSRSVAGVGTFRGRAARTLARLAPFAVAPLFLVMGVFTALRSGDATGAICSSATGALHLPDMAVMYASMALVHCRPWLRLWQRR
jgi:hypothetical protein